MRVDKRVRSLTEKYLVPPFRVAAQIVMHRSHLRCFKTNEWAIGIYKGTSPFSLFDPSDIRNPVLTATQVTDARADFVADPFMIQDQSTWFMFFEVMNSLRGKGEIGLAISRDCREWMYQRIVLREPFHLSYPFVFKWKNETLMIPESGEANRIALYRAKNFPHDWRYVETLIEGQFADHMLFRYEDVWWLFAGAEPLLHNSLRLFYADDLLGPWHEHSKSPLATNDGHSARAGGRVYADDSLVRLAQDCSPTYGRALNAFLISTLSRTDYREQAFAGNPVLKPGQSAWTLHGMHHMDAHELKKDEWLACVDGYARKLIIQFTY